MAGFDPLASAKKLMQQAAAGTPLERSDSIQVHDDPSENVLEAEQAPTAPPTLAEGEVEAPLASDGAELTRPGFGQHVAARLGTLRTKVVDKAVELREASIDAAERLIEELNGQLPALREAGYTLTEVSIQLGLPPKMTATFTSAPEIDEERINNVIEEFKSSKVTGVLIRSLYTAYKLQQRVRVGGMQPRGIMLELGLTPSAVIRFA